MIDQQKIGAFLRVLRKEKGLTQEQLAEQTGVTNRSVSRWETGTNLPDLALLVELAAFYEVELTELLNGERNQTEVTEMRKETEAVLSKAVDYSAYDRRRFERRLHIMFLAGTASFILFLVLEILGLADAGVTEDIASFALGLSFGMLLVGCLYTSRLFPKIQSAKQRWLHRGTGEE